jgi:hypothetical protein
MTITASGKITLPHSCPCPKYGCKKTANDYPSLDLLFGFRTIDNSVKNQSWCKECRNRALKESRERKKNN